MSFVMMFWVEMFASGVSKNETPGGISVHGERDHKVSRRCPVGQSAASVIQAPMLLDNAVPLG